MNTIKKLLPEFPPISWNNLKSAHKLLRNAEHLNSKRHFPLVNCFFRSQKKIQSINLSGIEKQVRQFEILYKKIEGWSASILKAKHPGTLQVGSPTLPIVKPARFSSLQQALDKAKASNSKRNLFRLFAPIARNEQKNNTLTLALLASYVDVLTHASRCLELLPRRLFAGSGYSPPALTWFTESSLESLRQVIREAQKHNDSGEWLPRFISCLFKKQRKINQAITLVSRSLASLLMDNTLLLKEQCRVINIELDCSPIEKRKNLDSEPYSASLILPDATNAFEARLLDYWSAVHFKLEQMHLESDLCRETLDNLSELTEKLHPKVETLLENAGYDSGRMEEATRLVSLMHPKQDALISLTSHLFNRHVISDGTYNFLKTKLGYITYDKKDIQNLFCNLGEHLPEEHLRAVTRCFLTDSSVYLDCGANVGVFTLDALKSGCQVHAFEANPTTFGCLQRTVSINGAASHVTCYNVAVSDEEGEADFYIGAISGHDSLYADENQSPIKVPMVRVDDLPGFPRNIDLIKLDIEGAEYRALKGMKRLVSENPLAPLLAEYALIHLDRAHISPEEWLSAFLDCRGLAFWVDKDSSQPFVLNELKTLDRPDGNILFLHPESLKQVPGELVHLLPS